MHVGIIKFTIRLPGNQSLKGKRHIVHSLCQKIRNKFNLSVAEVDQLDDLKSSQIGISFVSNSHQLVHQIISQILAYLQQQVGDFVLTDFNQEILTGW
jgi:uncharacterized protein YlxP (DUF503 family)